MITRNLLLLVSLCLWEGLAGVASASKIVRRRGLGGSHAPKLGESRAADQWDAGVDANANAMPVATLRNLITHEQAADPGSFPLAKRLQSHGAPPAANKERKAFKPKREVDSVSRKEGTLRILGSDKEEVKKVKNNTKNAETPARTGRPEKTFTIRRKPDLHGNKTRFKPGSRSRTRPDASVHAAGVPGKGFVIDSNRKLNLTGGYGLLKLLSKDNLVRIVNSQMQSAPGLSFPSKGSRSRKRDLIDVNRGHSEARRVPRQDAAVTLPHAGFDNQTAVPDLSAVTAPDLNPDNRINPLGEVEPALSKGQGDSGKRGGGDIGSKGLVRSLSTPRGEAGLGPERDVTISQTEPPFPSAKHPPPHAPSETNDSPQSALTGKPLGVGPGSGAADLHRDRLPESVLYAQTEPGTAQHPAGEDERPVNGSRVLRLRPSPDGKDGDDPESGRGLVFEEAESEEEEKEEEEARDRMEATGPRSRTRRSWIWNQFFVIEEYAGPEPVLIGRVRTQSDRHVSFTRVVNCFMNM
ncbi:Cadherin-24 [Liparis tanakae]|uniref:Cadherin-24 n=1 Tax=Liparis tanakae TaxID=230148 RepID=A0A4Z2FI34_9TELE|nr:Cadherin-24 [Liparis tanakae]